MSNIDDAIYNRLSSDSAIMSIAKTISPLVVPQNSPMPVIIYNKVSLVPVNAFGTVSSFASSRFQFDCYSKTSSEATNLASKIKASLDSFIGVILGVTIGGAMMIDQQSLYETDTQLFRESIDFNILHSI